MCPSHHYACCVMLQLRRARLAEGILIPKTLRMGKLIQSRKKDKEGVAVIAFMRRLVDVWAPTLAAGTRGPAVYFENNNKHLGDIFDGIAKSKRVAMTYQTMMKKVCHHHRFGRITQLFTHTVPRVCVAAHTSR